MDTGIGGGKYFNPHFRKGSDGKVDTNTQVAFISIHTSAREVTYKRKAKDEASRFQSTLPQGK